MKKCEIEVRYRDGRIDRADSVAEARVLVESSRTTATIEQVCTSYFCRGGKCMRVGKRKRRG